MKSSHGSSIVHFGDMHVEKIGASKYEVQVLRYFDR